MHIHVVLWEGDGYAFAVKALLDRFLEIEVHAPVVASCGPRPNMKVDAAICKFRDDQLVVEDLLECVHRLSARP